MNLYSWFSDFFKQLNVIVLTTFWLCIDCKYRYPTKGNSLASSWLSRAYYASPMYDFIGHFESIFLGYFKGFVFCTFIRSRQSQGGMSVSLSFCAHSFAKPCRQTSTTCVFFHSASTVFVRGLFSCLFYFIFLQRTFMHNFAVCVCFCVRVVFILGGVLEICGIAPATKSFTRASVGHGLFIDTHNSRRAKAHFMNELGGSKAFPHFE